ncbi:MAG: hypothetical protein ACOC42_00310, partial [Halobacteriota archaeon]
MLRRRYLHGSFAVATVPLSGCLGLLDSDEPTRDDLSDYDETGLRRYEEAYATGTETHDAFVERLQSDIESLENGQRSGNASFAAHDAATDLSEEFTAAHATYM